MGKDIHFKDKNIRENDFATIRINTTISLLSCNGY